METLDLQGTTKAKVQYAVLKDFWLEFGKQGHKYHYSAKSRDVTLSRLKDIGDFIVLRKNTPYKNVRDRAKFDNVKADRHKFKSHQFCFACREKAEVRHHIIWIKHGGLNSKKNLISLCYDCHTYIHPWMKRKQQ